jgi:hypothetical protein
MSRASSLSVAAERLLEELAGGGAGKLARRGKSSRLARRRRAASAPRAAPSRASCRETSRAAAHEPRAELIAELLAAGLIRPRQGGGAPPGATLVHRYVLTAAGRAHLARRAMLRRLYALDPFAAQHLALEIRRLEAPRQELLVNAAESPLAWLARRSLIAPDELQAGERLRADFTRAQMLPRTTARWDAPVGEARGGSPGASFSEAVVAARERVRRAIAAVGPEFSGLLLDVCCFLKPLAAVERERRWPPRSAKVLLRLALQRLARHYGLAAEARGKARAPLRLWIAPEAEDEAQRD